MDHLTVGDYARVVWRARWWVLVTVIVSMAVAGVATSMQPKTFRATATILAPREQSSPMSSFGALLGVGGKEGGSSIPGISVSLPGIAKNLDMFNALLKSRSMREEVLGQFAKSWGAHVGSMILGVETSYDRDRTYLSVIVDATNRQLAADLANAYFELLDQRLQRAADGQARRQEVFYRAQLDRAAREVDAAEEALMKFQQENRMVVNLDPTTKSSVDAGAGLRGSIMAVEMQRELLRLRYTDQHPQMREIEKQITELKRQYSKNLFGQAMDLPPEGPNAKGPRKEFFVSVDRMTPTQFAYLKLYRNLKIQETFYMGALQGLEQMRYATEGAVPQGIEILDLAMPPAAHIRPNVRVAILAGGVLGLVLGLVIALVREFVIRTWGPFSPAPARKRRAVVAAPTNGTETRRAPAPDEAPV